MKRLDTNQIAAISDMIRDMLGDDFDDATFWDSLDGETDAGDILDRLIWNTQTDQHNSDAIKEHEAALRLRRQRLEARATANKAAMLAVIDAAGVKKVERPCATVSRREGSVSVQITSPDDIPTQLCKVTRTPDKSAIKRQLDAGEAVPGAELVRGSPGVTVRAT
jgi:hypothetical protein